MTENAPAENLLRHETSPYLLQHKDNPVHWRPWGPAALAEAKATGKPILLSVGYSACHWCHVMAHESFEDPATAERMNALFVNVKVDREERPDIDAIYQQALAMLGEHGGWPLTMFLTPDGEPFWGGTYFPADAKYGRPGFRDVLDAIAATYRDQPDRVRHNVDALREGFEKLSKPQAGAGIDTATADDCARKLLEVVDWTNGGVGGAPKFPQPALLRQLWAAHERGVDSRCGEAVLRTLNRICEGGIYDHVGGGFARYAVDARWLVPHFEKMLYDNAQFLPLLAKAHLATGDPLYRRRAEATVAWLLEDMQTDAGGFASARDADSEGEEGKFYVWREGEIDALLGEDAPLFKDVYDVTPEGNWEGVTILNRLALDRALSEDEQARLDRALETLRRARAGRVPPLKDDKVLADWNGMTVQGLVEAGQHLERPDWIAAARRAFDFVAETMADPERGPGRLRHSFRAGSARHDGTIDDYVQMALAALALHEAIGESVYLDHAKTWADTLERHFHDDRPVADGGGGFFFTADDAEGLVTRTKTAVDNATPAGNGQAVALFWRLGALTGETRYHDRAEEIVRAFAGELARNAIPFASLIEGAVMLERGFQIVVVGDPTDAAARALLRAVHAAPLATRTLQSIRPEETLPEGHPAAGKRPVESADGAASAAYVCVGPVCEMPITDPDALSHRLTAG